MTCAKQESNKILFVNETRKKQGCDKKTYSKLLLNKLKVIKSPIFIYILKDLIQRSFRESFISMSSPCLPMWTMIVLRTD